MANTELRVHQSPCGYCLICSCVETVQACSEPDDTVLFCLFLWRVFFFLHRRLRKYVVGMCVWYRESMQVTISGIESDIRFEWKQYNCARMQQKRSSNATNNWPNWFYYFILFLCGDWAQPASPLTDRRMNPASNCLRKRTENVVRSGECENEFKD